MVIISSFQWPNKTIYKAVKSGEREDHSIAFGSNPDNHVVHSSCSHYYFLLYLLIEIQPDNKTGPIRRPQKMTV